MGVVMKFIVDVMLGKLAKWLRILGYDTLYKRDWEDDELIELARAEGRILLTADRELWRRRQVNRKIFISSDRWQEQLRELARVLPLDIGGLFTRCIECNLPLEQVSREEVRGLVPPYVHATQEDFGRCPNCGRIYWRGSHFAHALAEVRSLIGVGGDGDRGRNEMGKDQRFKGGMG